MKTKLIIRETFFFTERRHVNNMKRVLRIPTTFVGIVSSALTRCMIAPSQSKITMHITDLFFLIFIVLSLKKND